MITAFSQETLTVMSRITVEGGKTGIQETPHNQGPYTDYDRFRLHVDGYMSLGHRDPCSSSCI